jgi:hypothetical protein
VHDATEESISIFPNPTKDMLVVQGLTQSLTTANCRVFSVEGKQCAVNFTGNNSIDVNTLESGVYFLRLETIEGASSYQFLKF